MINIPTLIKSEKFQRDNQLQFCFGVIDIRLYNLLAIAFFNVKSRKTLILKPDGELTNFVSRHTINPLFLGRSLPTPTAVKLALIFIKGVSKYLLIRYVIIAHHSGLSADSIKNLSNFLTTLVDNAGGILVQKLFMPTKY